MNNVRPVFGLIAGLALCSCSNQIGFAQQIAETPAFRAGFARVNITPDKPVILAGYAARDGLSTGIHDSLFARVAVFEAGDNKIVLVTSDLLGFYNRTDITFSEAIEGAYGLAPHELFLASVHTHSAPTITLDEAAGHPNNVAYSRWLLGALKNAVGEAIADLSPAGIRSGTGSSPVGVNRREVVFDASGNPSIRLGRNPDGIHDRDVQVISVERNGAAEAILFNHAVHSTSLGGNNYIVSGDIHGTAERFVEQNLGVTSLAFAGASGDIDPWYRVLPGFETARGWIPETVLMGTMLGEEVVHVAKNQTDAVAAAPIFSVSETLQLPAKVENGEETSNPARTVPLNVGLARLGDVAMVCVGGEMLTEIGLAIKQASPFRQTLVFNHCNGTASYIAPAHIHLEGGYEADTSPFAPLAANVLIDRVGTLLHDLRRFE